MADGEELVLLRVVVINNREMIDRFLIAWHFHGGKTLDSNW